MPPGATAASRTTATSCIRREVNGRASSEGSSSIADTVEDAGAAAVNRTALHEKVLGTVDAVAHSRSHVDGGVLDGEVLAGLDAMLHVANDVQRTLLRKLGMPLDIETALL